MGRTETTISERKIVIELHNKLKSNQEISEIIKRSPATVSRIISRYIIRKTHNNNMRCGRPSKLSHRDLRFIKNKIEKNSFITASMITNELNTLNLDSVTPQTVRGKIRKLGYRNCVPRKKFYISEVNRQKRIQFAEDHINKEDSFWKNVLFSDESKFNIITHDGKAKVWRKPCTELELKNMIATVKHGGGSVMVWGCMAASGVGKLHILQEKIMDHRIYIQILKDNLQSSAEMLNLGDNYIFQQDNDPKHAAQNTKLWLLYNVKNQLRSPPQSPDLNPIEHVWNELGRRLQGHVIRNKVTLIEKIKTEWAKITPEYCNKLVSSMPRRLKAVLDNKGNPTKY